MSEQSSETNSTVCENEDLWVVDGTDLRKSKFYCHCTCIESFCLNSLRRILEVAEICFKQ